MSDIPAGASDPDAVDRWARIEAIFNGALELPEPERASFLEESCRGQPGLRSAVEDLLAADAAPDRFLESPAADDLPALVRRGEEAPGPPPRPGSEPEPLEGKRYGPYRLAEEIGRGGMGVVYLAERVDGQFEEKVALKILKRGMDSEEILRRFLRERQILAWLRHPRISTLLDGGIADDGSPYFVMEHVTGRPITRYCEENGLGVPERLRLFLQVCQGVQHAHRNLVVHRDLKPSNILVTNEGEVKLLDFGVARLLDERGEGAPTQTGHAALTPQYAAPEQLSGGSITTATDVYALGMVLYELLTGQLPYRVPGAALGSAAQHVLESDPERPSRAARTPRLRRRLAGDLDNIILKALRKDPTSRYGTVDAFAEDIARHMGGRPVLARPQSLPYRAGKFIRRHRVGVAAATVVLLALFGTLAGVLWQARATAREARKAEAIKDFLASLLELASPSVSKGETITTRQMLDRASARIDEELAGQPEVKAEILAIVGGMYLTLAAFDEAESLLTRAVDLQRELYSPRDRRLVTPLGRLATVYQSRADHERAERLFRDALDVARANAPRGDATVAYCLNDLAVLFKEKGDLEEAEWLHREALAIKRRVLGEHHPDVATSMNNIAVLVAERGDFEEAESLYGEALAIRREAYGNESPAVSNTLNNMMVLLRHKGDPQAAEPLAREALAIRRKLLGDRHPSVAWSLFNLGAILREKGDPEAGAPYCRQAISILQAAFGDDHPDVAGMRNGLAATLRAGGDRSGAEALSRDALATLRKHSPNHPNLALVLLELGRNLSEQERPGDAEPLLREAVELQEQMLGAGSHQVADAKLALGVVLGRLGREEEASVVLIQAHEVLRSKLGDSHAKTLAATRAIADLDASRALVTGSASTQQP